MSEANDKASRFEDLTWEDVEDWAGSTIVSRGRGYQRCRAVKQLALAPNGAILAWVDGSERYATCVDIDAKYNLSSTCTCPYWSTCKHAVAVMLTYLDQLEDGAEVPTVNEEDSRWVRLQSQVDDVEAEDDDEWFEEEWEDEDRDEDDGEDDDEDEIPGVNTWQNFVAGHTKAQLIDILSDLARRFPEVQKALQDQYELAAGKAAQLVQTVRSEIAGIGVRVGWSDDWDDIEERVDYNRMRGHMRELLNHGHADEVLTVGEELLQAGIEQVGSSHDDGAAYDITQCMQIVFQALPHSTLSSAEQILWVIDAQLKDDYDLCDDTEGFWDVEKPADAWSTVADALLDRLTYPPPEMEDSYGSGKYGRNCLADRIVQALEHAGRHDEIVPLCEREAEITSSYVRLVDRLQQAERWDEAEHWIRQGIDATQERLPGIANQLRGALQQMREQSGDWSQVAALRAEAFFHHPNFNTFEALRKAAEQAEVWPVVRDAAMHYLETGERPSVPAPGAKRKPKASAWPLPQPDVVEPESRWQTRFPQAETLIDIAIAEKRPDEALRWYDQRGKRPVRSSYVVSYDDKVAAAVLETYPDRAIAIWQRQAEAYIGQAQVKSYETAAGYLRRVRQLLQNQDWEAAWQDYLATLRKTHRRKYRLMEILDRLNDSRTITGAVPRKRRR